MRTPHNTLPRWLLAMIVVTVLLVLYNAPDIYNQLPDTWKHRRGSFLMLFEMNYPTWWTGMLLFSAALLFLESASTRERSLRTACAALGALTGALSIDEIGSIHERVSILSDVWFGSPWTALAPFALLGMIALVAGVRGIRASVSGRRAAGFVVGGFVVFALVVVQEYLEHHPEFPKFMMKAFGIKPGGRIVIEEVTEMVGAMLVLVGAALVRSRDRFAPPLGFVLARPLNISLLQPLLVAGLILHCLVAFFLLPDSRELTLRGNPAGWYPPAVFFLLFCHGYWQYRDFRDRRNAGSVTLYGIREKTAGAGWLLMGLFSLICSIGFLHSYGHLIGEPVLGLQKPFFFNLHVVYSSLILSVLVLAIWLDLRSPRHLYCLLLLLLAPAVEFSVTDPGSGFAASGIFAFVAAALFLTPAPAAPGRRTRR